LKAPSAPAAPSSPAAPVQVKWKDVVRALKLPLKQAKTDFTRSCKGPPEGTAVGAHQCGGAQCLKTEDCVAYGFGMVASGDRCACGAYNDE
jgi:hypothetical protein